MSGRPPTVKGGPTALSRSGARDTKLWRSTRHGMQSPAHVRHTSNPSDSRRVVVKFRPGIVLPYDDSAASKLLERAGHAWEEITGEFPGVTFGPYFTTITVPLLRELQTPSDSGTGATDFTSYFAVECPPGTDWHGVARKFATWESVERAYVESPPVPPPVDPASDPRFKEQGWHRAAPFGIDSLFAWDHADGSNVRFVDLERGWVLTHEDLKSAKVTLISGLNKDFKDHGTAILGLVRAADNRLGGIGIAPKATASVVSQWRAATIYSISEAILSAITSMSAGDVLLLETQIEAPVGPGVVPCEMEDLTFDAIRTAASRGIAVIEPSANGSRNLNTVVDQNGKRVLDRSSADFRDSGAIVVSASQSPSRSRLTGANFGNRVDCFAWGL